MAPPPSKPAVSPFVILIVRVLTLISVAISVIITITNKATTTIGLDSFKIKFNDFYAYRYMIASGVIGGAYTLLQIALTIFYVSSGNRLGGDVFCLVDFYGDKILSYLLATGAAACFGLTIDLKRIELINDSEGQRFLNKANAAGSLIFIGFIFSVISSIFSSLALPKRP